jgi:DNA-binding NarL/FixJ family response regulator
MGTMKPPMYVGPLSSKQRQRLESGLRSRDGFELRRCQILLASARGERPSQIAAYLGCTAQTVRNTLWAYEFGKLIWVLPQFVWS